MKRLRNLLLIITCLFLVPMEVPWARGIAEDQNSFFDYQDNLHSYSMAVAGMNKIYDIIIPKSQNAEKPVCVLCRTDGHGISFSETGPMTIIAGPSNCFTLYYRNESEAGRALALLQENPGIIYAETDGDIVACSNSASFYSHTAADIGTEDLLRFAKENGKTAVLVAVIDSGVFRHPFIQDKLYSSGIDYVDADQDATNDLYGHGTQVAGVIADCTKDASVFIYPLRVLNENGGGKISNTVNAIREATNQKAAVINISLESKKHSEALDDAIIDAVNSGITVVVSAGNSACDTVEVCPAHLTGNGVIVVGSAEGSNGSYNKASYSNFGSSVDVFVCGTSVNCCSVQGGFSLTTGTSIAAPHISSICALLKTVHPELTPGQCEKRIVSVCNESDVPVPDVSLLVPSELGFSLSHITLSKEERFVLPSYALPVTSMEKIELESSDLSVIAVDNNTLVPMSTGSVDISVRCLGFDDSVFSVIVSSDSKIEMILPSELTELEDESFYGSRVTNILIPSTVLRIGDRVFDHCDSLRTVTLTSSLTDIGENSFSDAVILLPENSLATNFAKNNHLQYVYLKE